MIAALLQQRAALRAASAHGAVVTCLPPKHLAGPRVIPSIPSTPTTSPASRVAVLGIATAFEDWDKNTFDNLQRVDGGHRPLSRFTRPQARV